MLLYKLVDFDSFYNNLKEDISFLEASILADKDVYTKWLLVDFNSIQARQLIHIFQIACTIDLKSKPLILLIFFLM